MSDPGTPFRTERRGRLVPRRRVIGRTGPSRPVKKYDESDGDPGAVMLNLVRAGRTRPASQVEPEADEEQEPEA